MTAFARRAARALLVAGLVALPGSRAAAQLQLLDIHTNTAPVGETFRAQFLVTGAAPTAPLQFSIQGKPPGATFDAAHGVLQWTPTTSDVGEHDLVVAADQAGAGTTSRTYSLLVEPAEHPPVINPAGDRSVAFGSTAEIKVSAHDPDGDAMSYAVYGLPDLPPGSTFDPANATFQWTPKAGVVKAGASYRVRFQVRDTRGGVAEDTVRVVVTDQQLPPAFPSRSLTVDLYAGEPFARGFPARDPNSDPITYAAAALPAGASFNPRTAELSWTPPETFVPSGQYARSVSLNLTASDGFGAGTLALTLEVLPNPTDPVTVMATRYEFVTQGVSQDLATMDSLESAFGAEANRRTRRKNVVHYLVIGISTVAGGFQLAKSSTTRSVAAGLGALVTSSLELLGQTFPSPDEPLKQSAQIAPIRAKLEQAYASFKGLYPARPPDAELLDDNFRTAVDGVLSTRQQALQDLAGLSLRLTP